MAVMTSKNQLSEFLKQVALALDIPDEIREEVDREYQQLCEFIEEQDADANRKEPKLYSQGSFRLGTTIRPMSDKDEYDIDLVYERDLQKSSTTRDGLKAEAGEHLAAYLVYLEESNQDVPKLKEGDRCWTLNHEGQFHMDILPAIPDEDVRANFAERTETAIAITDNASSKWHTSNPIGFCDWFCEQMREQFDERRKSLARAKLSESSSGMIFNEQMLKAAAEDIPEYKVKTTLQRSIQILKRHRDFYFQDDKDNRPASIVIATLAAHAYGSEDNLVDALLTIVRGMEDFIEPREEGGKIVSWVENPTDAEENFADRWQDKEHPDRERCFRAWLRKVEADVTQALVGGGIHKMVDLLGISLGRSVVKTAAANMGGNFYQSSQAGSLGIVKGAGTLATTAEAGSTPDTNITPVRRHTFYGDNEQSQED